MSTTPTFLSSSKEFIWLPVYNSGTLVTTGVNYSVVLQPGTEGTHSPADVMNGKTGRVINQLAPGTYKVWASVTGGVTELPHIYLGEFRVI